MLDRARFKVIAPKTLGVSPSPRYMHTMNFMPTLNYVAIYGGRNDMNMETVILSDLWVLKLHNLEWVKVQIGGQNLPNPRCNHCMIANGSRLFVFGGQGKNFHLFKNVLSIELDQDKIERRHPVIDKFTKSINKDIHKKKVEHVTNHVKFSDS